jgi:hypothetical protein
MLDQVGGFLRLARYELEQELATKPDTSMRYDGSSRHLICSHAWHTGHTSRFHLSRQVCPLVNRIMTVQSPFSNQSNLAGVTFRPYFNFNQSPVQFTGRKRKKTLNAKFSKESY